MPSIGKTNTLKVLRKHAIGVHLDGLDLGDILLPNRYLPEKCNPGDEVTVFIYLDSEDRIIATTEKPHAEVGDFVLLKVISVNSIGAFLDWGLSKDLLVPFREQKQKMEEGKFYVVYVYVDEETKRIIASSKVERFLNQSPAVFEVDQEVDLMIYSQGDIGYNAIINGTHTGILYQNEVFEPLQKGQKTKGFIKKLREDGKIDLCLHKGGYEKVDALSEKIIDKLKEQGGFIAVNDKSPAETIYALFGMSKKTYKKAVGGLYKKRLLTMDDKGIKLVLENE